MPEGIRPIGDWLEVAGLVLAILLAFCVKEVEAVRSKLGAHRQQAVLLILAGSIFGLAYWRWHYLGLATAMVFFCITVALWVWERYRDYRPYRKVERGRWESVIKVRYGHLEYEPFLYYQRKDGNPSGIGVKLLERLLAIPSNGKIVEVKPFWPKRNWDDVVDGLVKDEYDVVATPLFATFDRSKYVAFTAPLCFSNVGLYVSKEVSHLTAFKNLTIDKLRDSIRDSGVVFLSVKGEISEKLAAKYCDKAPTCSHSGTIASLFSQVKNSTRPYYALFCESFYADDREEVKSDDVVNVLPSHSILYPVCFAVRLGDYQLINLLNIRLLQFNQSGGALPLLAEEWAKSRGYDLDVNGIKRHFVAEWPCPIPLKGRAHA